MLYGFISVGGFLVVGGGDMVRFSFIGIFFIFGVEE